MKIVIAYWLIGIANFVVWVINPNSVSVVIFLIQLILLIVSEGAIAFGGDD